MNDCRFMWLFIIKNTGYNQVLVMIDHFTKYAEAAPCMTASAEETCDHLIKVWIARHGYPITFQSDNGKAFVGDLTKELRKRSQVAQAHSTTYHQQTTGLVERENRTLVSILRVYCSRYMDLAITNIATFKPNKVKSMITSMMKADNRIFFLISGIFGRSYSTFIYQKKTPKNID